MNNIIRGTNATIQIKIKEHIDFSNITALELYICQPAHSIVKTLEELTLDAENQTINYELTQEESLSFIAGREVEIFSVGVVDGKRFETRPIIRVNVENTRKNEVMS